jgi:hypothetical protein
VAVSKARVTAVTTVTGSSHIPPLRVAQIFFSADRTLLRNSARGDTSESGYNGYGGYGQVRASSRAHARVGKVPISISFFGTPNCPHASRHPPQRALGREKVQGGYFALFKPYYVVFGVLKV